MFLLVGMVVIIYLDFLRGPFIAFQSKLHKEIEHTFVAGRAQTCPKKCPFVIYVFIKGIVNQLQKSVRTVVLSLAYEEVNTAIL